MKFTLLFALPAAISAAAIEPRQSYFSFGNSFSTGPVATNSFIRQATTTLVLPQLQCPHNGNLGLWPGVGTKFPSGADGQLVQGLAISTVGEGSPCNFNAAQVNWCIVASTFSGIQTDGEPYAAQPGDYVTYDYKYNDSTLAFDQTVSVNGIVVSTLSTVSGEGAGWGTAMECQQTECGTVPTHHYLNTTIVMDTPDPDYGQTMVLTGASGTLSTMDGGKTWTVPDITINQYTYQPTS